MPKYRYLAINDKGKWFRGKLEAASLEQASEKLRDDGLWVAELFDMNSSILHKDVTDLLGGPKIKTQHFTVFCRQLSTMYKSGVNMVLAIQILSEQTESKPFRKVLLSVADDMRKGAQFSDAVSQFPSIFTTVFINMIKAGEASGNLDDMLDRLALFYEKEHYTKVKVRSAMIYPIIMSIVMVMVVVFMMIFVIPRYIANFQAMGLELPLPTRIVIHISDFIQQYWYIVIAALFIPMLVTKIMRTNAKGRYILDYVQLKIPVFGQLKHKQAIARFARTFSSLFAAAIPILQTMTIVSNVVNNDPISRVIADSRESIRSGQPMAEPFMNTWLFPPMVVQMMSIGEKTGSLDSMMEKVADFYEADVDAMADRLKSLLEPLMIIAISGVVGGIVLAVLMPTFKLMETLQ